MYQVIPLTELKKRKQYDWFRTFANPCYGVNVKMDVTKLVNHSQLTKTNFFINTIYLITKGLNAIEELRLREVGGEIRLYHTINPTFTVMTKLGVYENAGFSMVEDYPNFYSTAEKVIDQVKNHTFIKAEHNDNGLFNDYYMTCLPWLATEGMVHPLPNNNYESSSCPRVAWDKYREENGMLVMVLNITVNHCFVDGFPLAQAFQQIQKNFDNADILCK